MIQKLFRFIKALLCVAAGALLSVIELGFFSGIGILSLTFLVILIVTVAAVFMYIRSENSCVFICIYTVCLFFVLELSGKSADIITLLSCLSALALLFAHARFERNADRFRVKKPPYGANLLAIITCAAIVFLTVFQLYTYILLPRLSESEVIELPEIIETLDEPVMTPPPLPAAQNMHADSASPYTATPFRQPRGPDIWRWVLIACISIICAVAAFIMHRYRKYRSWVSKTLSSPPEKQISEFYMHFLRCLAICGFPRKTSETPFDYLCNMETEEFPLPPGDFTEITGAFAAVRFGGKPAAQYVCEASRSLFKSLPELVKLKKGRKFYYLHYIRKMHLKVRSVE